MITSTHTSVPASTSTQALPWHDQCCSTLKQLAETIINAVKAVFEAFFQIPTTFSTFLSSFRGTTSAGANAAPKNNNIHLHCGQLSLLHDASFNHKNGQLDKLLQNSPEKGKDYPNGITALHAAIYKKNLEGTKLLVAAGSDIEKRDINGQTPMHWAAYKGNVPILNLLFILGADLNVKDRQGQTPLRIAARHGFLPAVSMLLALGADKEAMDAKKQTPYFVARLYGHLEIAKYLADVGAETEIVNSDGRSASEVTGRACPSSFFRQLFSFGKHELRPASRDKLIEQAVMIV